MRLRRGIEDVPLPETEREITGERILPEYGKIGVKELREIVGQGLGAASMCWAAPERAGVFQSRRAAQILEEVMQAALQFAQLTRRQREEEQAPYKMLIDCSDLTVHNLRRSARKVARSAFGRGYRLELKEPFEVYQFGGTHVTAKIQVFAYRKAPKTDASELPVIRDLRISIDKIAWQCNLAGTSQEFLNRLSALSADIEAELGNDA
jgi:hypothetical protein